MRALNRSDQVSGSLLRQSTSLLLDAFGAYRSRGILLLFLATLFWIPLGFGQDAITKEPYLPEWLGIAVSLLAAPPAIAIGTLLAASAYTGQRHSIYSIIREFGPRLSTIYRFTILYALLQTLITAGLSLIWIIGFVILIIINVITHACTNSEHVTMLCALMSDPMSFDYNGTRFVFTLLSASVLWLTSVAALSVAALPTWLMCIPVIVLDYRRGVSGALARSRDLLVGNRKLFMLASALGVLVATGVPSLVYLAYSAIWIGYGDAPWWIGVLSLVSFALLWPLPLFVATRLYTRLSQHSTP
jgi:hypothetical protein